MLILFLGSFAVWMWEMLLVFRKYILPQSPGLKCEVYIYICFKKRREERRSEKLVPSGTTGTVDQESSRSFWCTSPVHCPSCPEQGAPFPTLPPQSSSFFETEFYRYTETHALHTSTMKMEAVYTSETSSTYIRYIIQRTKLTSLSCICNSRK
jgi:hypothetical protein